ncbi:response regulator [Microvirga tunisiensis]|nr:response regulator [Microvirga tunisiensis]
MRNLPAPQQALDQCLAQCARPHLGEGSVLLLDQPVAVGSRLLHRPIGAARATPYRIERIEADRAYLVPIDQPEAVWVKMAQTAPIPETVLVVDDDPLIRLLVCDSLEDEGFVTLCAASGDEALGLLQGGAEIDAVVSDIDMPGSTDGLALARWLTTQQPGLPVFLVSGRSAHELEGMPEGVTFLQKPHAMTSLPGAVRRALPDRPAHLKT